ncbi:zinc-ribbon domain-containing protein [Lentzea kentuckyensis]|uniref:zinc-ribbon domain-containing protein n=1 Tax=Lentzea kentuckyensis TaxID=360086 RepID=UPI001179A49B|nr:zinc-ribbon domain-containing protein [Lentzea kentuckyensis]
MVVPREKSIAALFPHLVPEFVGCVKYPELTPDLLSPNSGLDCTWLCPTCEKPWPARPEERTKGRGRVCPTLSCRGQVSFAEARPHLVPEFVEFVKKSHRSLHDIPSGSEVKCLWRCPSGHSDYPMRLNTRTKGSGCPDCGAARAGAARRKPKPGRSLADTHPHLTAQFVRNLTSPGSTPDQLSYGSNDRCVWRCPLRHEREIVVKSRARNGCPGCGTAGTSLLELKIAELLMAATGAEIEVDARRPVAKGNKVRVDLHLPAIDLFVDLDPDFTHGPDKLPADLRKNDAMADAEYVRIRSTNAPLIPRSIVVAENEPWYRPWEWAQALAHELTNRGLPWRDLTDAEQAEAVHRATLRWFELPGSRPKVSALDATPQLAAEFVINKDRPGVELCMLPPGAGDKCRWRCVYGHEWETKVRDRTKPQGTGCPDCDRAARGRKARERAIAAPGESLADRRPDLAAQFVACIDRPELTEHTMKPGAELRCRWLCDHGHEWEALANNRSKPNGTRCPDCAQAEGWKSRGIAKPGEALADKRPEIAAEFLACIDRPELTTHTLKPHSKYECSWCCGRCGHNWTAVAADRKRPWCESCNSKAGWDRRRQNSAKKSLAEVRPEIAAEFIACVDRPELTAQTLTPGTKFKCLWRCTCGHEWTVAPQTRRRPGCRSCNLKKGWKLRRSVKHPGEEGARGVQHFTEPELGKIRAE